MRDIALAMRRLARRRSFSFAAILTLAIGIGATTAIFSAIHAALLDPLPYPRADDIYLVRSARADGMWSNGWVSSADLTAIVQGAPSIETVAGATGTGTDVVVTDDGRHVQVAIGAVTDGFFDLTGASMALGHGAAIEPREGSWGALVLSHALWVDAFAEDPGVIGESIRLATGPATIVGVAPASFDLPAGTDAWTVFSPDPESDVSVYEGIVRVSPGTSPEQLRSELEAVSRARVELGLDGDGSSYVASQLIDSIVGDLGAILWMAFAAAGGLLLLSCVNIAVLMLARGSVQVRELAIAEALGANRRWIVRQVFTEAVLLATMGTILGIVLGRVGTEGLTRLGSEQLPRLGAVPFDLNVLLLSVGALLLTTVVIAAFPLLGLGRLDVRGRLAVGSPQATDAPRSRAMLNGIVVVEIAVAVALTSSAGWLVQSYRNLTTVDPGFVPEGRLVFRAALVGSTYMPIERIAHDRDGTYLVPGSNDRDPETWLDELTSELEAVDQVDAIGLGGLVPFRRDAPRVQYVFMPGGMADPSQPSLARFRFASPEYFRAMGIDLIAGRTLSRGDPRTLVVVNEAFVRAYAGGQDPVGASFQVGFQPGDFRSERTIVGVVADVRFRSLQEPDPPAFYSLVYDPRGFVVISTSLADPTPLIPRVRSALHAVDPSIPATIEPLHLVMSAEIARHRFGLFLMGLFAIMSLALAAIGVHGVVSHDSSTRRGEFAVRIALGAEQSVIARSILRRGAALWLTGVSVGLVVVLVAGRLGTVWLYNVAPADPLIIAVAVGCVSALVFGAFILASFQGARVEPARALAQD